MVHLHIKQLLNKNDESKNKNEITMDVKKSNDRTTIWFEQLKIYYNIKNN